ncbi:MAG: hypothetical protein JSV70_07285 [bacterium]|nr:MAG: hypothetical protein JSV70_07285 [bacterium]
MGQIQPQKARPKRRVTGIRIRTGQKNPMICLPAAMAVTAARGSTVKKALTGQEMTSSPMYLVLRKKTRKRMPKTHWEAMRMRRMETPSRGFWTLSFDFRESMFFI